MNIYAYDENGIYVATIFIQKEEEDGYVLEPYTTFIPPPEEKIEHIVIGGEKVPVTYTRVFDGETWSNLPISKQPNPYSVLRDGIWVEDATLKAESLNREKRQAEREIRNTRDSLIAGIKWRVERHRDEVDMGLTPTEPIGPLLTYIQALRDIPQQPGFPEDIIWPEVP